MLSEDEVEQIIQNNLWAYIGHGTYNTVSISNKTLSLSGYNGQYVWKQPLTQYSDSHPTNAVNKWNMINPQYPALKGKTSWIAPYLGDVIASDLQIAEKVIEIYRDTGIIVIDATAKKNMLVYNGQVVCIDVDMAYNKRVLRDYMNNPKNKRNFSDFLNKSSIIKPYATSVIKTLIYLQEQVDEHYIDKKYLTYSFIKLLHQFRYQNKPMNPQTLNNLYVYTTINTVGALFTDEKIPEVINIFSLISDALCAEHITINHYNHSYVYAKLKQYSVNQHTFINAITYWLNGNDYVLSQITNDNWTLLHLAALDGNQVIINYLLTQKVPREAKALTSINNWAMSAVDLAIYYQHNNTACTLLDHKGAISPFIYQTVQYIHFPFKNKIIQYLINADDLKSIQGIINHNITLLEYVDEEGYTFLHYAALNGRTNIVHYLIEQGMSVNKQGKNNANCLGLAMLREEFTGETCALLKSAGAIPYFSNGRTDYKTFKTLIEEDDLTEIKILVANNPSIIDHVDVRGNSFLHHAVRAQKKAIVLYLMEQGADVNKENLELCSSFDLAKRLGYEELTSLLAQRSDFVDCVYIERNEGLNNITPSKKIPEKSSEGLLSSVFNFFSHHAIPEIKQESIQKKTYIDVIDEDIFPDYDF